MRDLIFFGPFLWLRRVVLWILILLLSIVLALYFIGNSSLVVKKAVEEFAPDYNISYENIEGNALSGFEIKNPRYNNESIAKEIILKWNPNTLANRQITVSKLHLKEANIEVIKALVSQFSSEQNSTEVDTNSSEPLGFYVELEDVSLSTQPFEIEGVLINHAILNSNIIAYKDDKLNIDSFNLSIESNISTISLQGNYENQVVSLKDVKLLDVNLTAIESMLGGENNNTEIEVTTQTEPSPLLPKEVNIETIELRLLPYVYDPMKLSNSRLLAKNVSYDVERNMMTKANLELNATTNLSYLYYTGEIKDNQLLGQVILKPQEELYTKYEIPLRKDAISEIRVDINVSEKLLIADIRTQGQQILDLNESEFNVDIDSFMSHVVYDLNSSHLTANTKAEITAPYAKNIIFTNQLRLEDEFKHHGKVHIASIEGVDARFVKPLENLVIDYSGDDKSIETTFTSEEIKGYFKSDDFKNADAHIESMRPLRLSTLTTLPTELEAAEVSLVIDAPLNLQDFSKINAKVKLNSNVINVDADVKYGDVITIEGDIVISSGSLIKSYSKEVEWDTLSPLNTTVVLKDKQISLNLDSESLKSNLQYGMDSGALDGKVHLAGLVLDISGYTEEKLAINTKIKSVKELGNNINQLYHVGELPPLEGVIDVSLVVDKLKTLEMTVSSPELIYKADRKTNHIIKDVRFSLGANEKQLLLKSYKATYKKQKYFSTKVATVNLGESISVSNFWVNDELQVNGMYDTSSKKGDFQADAKRFHIQDKIVDIYANITLNAVLDGNDTRVKGKVVLLKGDITPDIEGRSFATDSDIIILQELRDNAKSPFMDNLSLMLRIETKEALKLRQGPLNIKLKPDFVINKDKGGELLYLGSVDLIKGGTYIFQEKKFVLGDSAVYFTGDVNKPLLDIKANYKSINHLITIAVTGTPEEPNINFSSSPSLTREQILSVILFDSEGSGDTHSGNEMMKMMGGAMAKAALSDAGVKVDHLAFGEGNSIEVGKKISSKSTVIYINGEVPKVKLKYQHGKRTESVIGVSEQSQSYDIIYKRDF